MLLSSHETLCSALMCRKGVHLARLNDGELRLRAVAPVRSGMYDATRIPAIREWPSPFQTFHYIFTWM